VTVLGAQGVMSNVLVELSALRAGVGRTPDRHSLDQAINHLRQALEPSLWLDQTHLERRDGDRVFNEEKAAVQELVGLVNRESGGASAVILHGIINRIASADWLLASVAIQDAAAVVATPKQLTHALQEVRKGEQEAAQGQFEAGIAHFRDAWKYASHLTLATKSEGHRQLKPRKPS